MYCIMRISQWYLIGIFFMIMSFWFIREDMVWTYNCNIFDDNSPLSKTDMVMCLNQEIYDPFIWLLFPLGWIFIICGWMESRAEKRKQELAEERWVYEGGQVPEHMRRIKGMYVYAPKKHPTSKDIEELEKIKDKTKK